MKTNGGRTRNLPFHVPEKWATFKSYNKRDVEVEMVIQQRLHYYPVPEQVWDEYHIDQEINDRGIAVDKELVRQAVAIDAMSRTPDGRFERKDRAGKSELCAADAFLAGGAGDGNGKPGKKQVAEMLKTVREPLRSVLLAAAAGKIVREEISGHGDDSL